MKIVLIILAIIGLLKLVSLFILCIIEVYNKLKDTKYLEVNKTYGIYKPGDFYIIPTITCSVYGNHPIRFDISFMWLNLKYYSSYCLIYEDDE